MLQRIALLSLTLCVIVEHLYNCMKLFGA